MRRIWIVVASQVAIVVSTLSGCDGCSSSSGPASASFDSGSPFDGTADDSSMPGPDANAEDSGSDSGAPESGPADTGAPDTGSLDTGMIDTGVTDTGATDTGGGDGGAATVSVRNVFAHTILHSGFLVGVTTGAITSVEVAVDAGAYAAASGTASWSFALPAFKLGTVHTVQVRAHAGAQTFGPVSATFRAGTNQDVNGDGFPDLLVGAPSSPSTGIGTAYLYASSGGVSIPTGTSVMPTTTFRGAGEYFGYSLALGDVNGDGYADVVVGDIDATGGNGAAYVFDGLSAAGLSMVAASAAKTTISGAAGEALGVVTAGDIDGDGYADVAIGAQQAGGSTVPGAVYVFKSRGASGIASGASSTATATLTGPTGGRLGVALSIGDANGDGFGDLLAGAWGYNNGGTINQPGSAYVFQSTGASGIPSQAYSSAATALTDTLEQFAEILTFADVNGDGYDDAIVTSVAYDINHGAVYIFQSRGAPGIASAASTNATTLIAGPANGYLGNAVAVGDVNGDGFGDLVATAGSVPSQDAYVYLSGGSSGLATTPATTLVGPSVVSPSYAEFGSAVSALDVNGDGFADVTVGASATYVSNVDVGAAYVFRSAGSAGVASVAYTAATTSLSAPAGASQFGVGVAP
jgi:hypothetical protein